MARRRNSLHHQERTVAEEKPRFFAPRKERRVDELVKETARNMARAAVEKAVATSEGVIGTRSQIIDYLSVVCGGISRRLLGPALDWLIANREISCRRWDTSSEHEYPADKLATVKLSDRRIEGTESEEERRVRHAQLRYYFIEDIIFSEGGRGPRLYELT